jgi:AcrR family transcriptional regulator
VPRLTPARAAERKRQILDAAVACFAKRGFTGTTMQHICTRAKLSPGAVYCWFASKQEIVAAIADERHGREREIFERATAGAEGTAHAAAKFFDELVAWLAEPSERGRRRLTVQIWSEALFDAKLRRTLDRGIAQRELAARFFGGRNADAIGCVLMSLVLGLVLQLTWDPELDVAAYRDVAVAMISAYAR